MHLIHKSGRKIVWWDNTGKITERDNYMKKNTLLVIAIIVIMASFVACKNEESVEKPVASEPASSFEDVSEEVTEEASSEEVTGEFYSAEEIMKLIDELTAKYTYDDPEFIKSLVIAANLDYITDEDLATLLSTYGYTIEELNAIYKSEQGIGSTFIAYSTTREIFSGYSGVEYSEGTDYSKRLPAYEVMLNENDQKYATEFHESSLRFGDLGEYADADVVTSGEITTKSFAYIYQHLYFPVTAYDNYLNQNAS